MFSPIISLLALVVSFLALAVSALTAWITLLRKGEIRMTLPTVIYFGSDGGSKDAARYFAHVRPPPQTELPLFFREMFVDAEK